ncbi:unnamed protein product [Anisakis simplex]|uniref:Sortilin_C domain-containing protein n=1 Tax=Anisakis simplex TaxID=6269 RepID=A0A0M3JL58_ANISI|nr:unnamed protein product [Anisakis simplex]
MKCHISGCGSSRRGHKQMLCPSRSTHQYDVCITAEQLCDDVVDCPGGEDENPTNCLFYKSVSSTHFDYTQLFFFAFISSND